MSDELPDTVGAGFRGWLAAVGFTLVLLGGEMMAERDGARFWSGMALILIGFPVFSSAALWRLIIRHSNIKVVSALAQFADRAPWWLQGIGILALSFLISQFIPHWSFSSRVPQSSMIVFDTLDQAGASDRHLTNDQKRKLLSEIAPLVSSIPVISIAFANGDPEAENYAHDFADVFRRTGVHTWFAYTNTEGLDETGVIIVVREIIIAPSPEVLALKEALYKVGIIAPIRVFEKDKFSGTPNDPNWIKLYVAPKSLD